MQNRQAQIFEPALDASVPDSAVAHWDETEQRILDAAATMLLTHGIDGLTITGIATRSGVSRPTVYRRWQGTDDIVRATLLRTTISLFARLGDLPQTGPELAATVVQFSRLFREDPLFRHLLEHQPELFTQYSLERLGSSQRFMLHWIKAAVERGQHDGSIRRGEPAEIAIMLLLIAQSATLSHRSVEPFIDDTALDHQLLLAAEGFLRA